MVEFGTEYKKNRPQEKKIELFTARGLNWDSDKPIRPKYYLLNPDCKVARGILINSYRYPIPLLEGYWASEWPPDRKSVA